MSIWQENFESLLQKFPLIKIGEYKAEIGGINIAISAGSKSDSVSFGIKGKCFEAFNMKQFEYAIKNYVE